MNTTTHSAVRNTENRSTSTGLNSLLAAAEMMINKGIGCLPVVDAQQLIGVVTKTDLLRCLQAMDAA